MRALLLALLATLLIAAPATAAPEDITAESAILVETVSGDVAFERKADERRPIASTTKLMTALLTLERAKPDQVIPAARYRGGPLETVIGLRPGEEMTVSDLLRALLLHSANDAAYTLAQGVGGSVPRFVRLMNRRARQLGLKDTHYANPIGLDDPGNYSTARDLVKLTLKLQEFKFFRQTVNRTQATLESGATTRTIRNRNQLVRRDARVNGVKTGQTQGAGWVLVASGRNNRGIQVIAAVLGSASDLARQDDALTLLKYGWNLYRVAEPLEEGREMARVPIRYRRGAQLPLVAGETVTQVIRKGGPKATFSVVGVPDDVVGPIREGQRFGTIIVNRGSDVVARVPLVAAAAVPEAGVAQRTKDYFTRPFTLLLVVAVLGCTVLLAHMRRRPGSRKRRSRREPETA
jgi:serine-type D-Ala-D-Ala carboxypeptidase (penicillin-binding protein 5/6)